MRHATCAVLSALLALSCSGPLMAEESTWWWPFGGDDTSSQVAVSTAPTTPSPSVATGESDSWFSWPAMPEISWPELPFGSEADGTNPQPARRPRRYGMGKAAQSHRNRWAQNQQQAVTPTSDTSPWEMMTESARRVGESTRNAWDKTVDFVTPGEAPTTPPPIAAQTQRPSWWSRLRGGDAAEPQGPRTVTEWMAQERLDP